MKKIGEKERDGKEMRKRVRESKKKGEKERERG